MLKIELTRDLYYYLTLPSDLKSLDTPKLIPKGSIIEIISKGVVALDQMGEPKHFVQIRTRDGSIFLRDGWLHSDSLQTECLCEPESLQLPAFKQPLALT